MARTKTPVIPLVQSSESLEVCFAIILASLDHWVPLTELRRDLAPGSSTDPLGHLAAAAARRALEAERFEGTRASLEEQRMPVILRWDPGHFVVLEGRDGTAWWINDPKGGPRAIPHEDFERKLPMQALKLRATADFRSQGRAPSIRRSLGRILRGTRAAFVAVGVAAVGLVLGNFALAGLLTYFMDRILVDRIPDRIPPFLIAVGVVQALRAIFTYLQAQYSLRIERAVVLRLEVECLRHMAELPGWEVGIRAPGDVQERLAMMRKFSNTIVAPLASAPSNVVTVFLFGGAILMISPPVVLALVGSIVFGASVAKFASQRIFTLSSAKQRAFGLQRATMLNGLNSKLWLAESGASGPLIEQWLGQLAEAKSLAQEDSSLQLVAQTARLTVNQLAAQVGSLVLGGLGVIAGTVTIGELAALQTLVSYETASITALVNLLQSFPVIRANLVRVEDILDTPRHRPTSETESNAEQDGVVLRLHEVAVDGGGLLSASIRAGEIAFVENLSAPAAAALAARLCGEASGPGKVVQATAPRKSNARRGVLRLAGRFPLHPGTIQENLAGFDPRINADVIWRALDDVELGDEFRWAGHGLAELVGELGAIDSTGREAAFQLAAALAQPPMVAVACGALARVSPRVARRVVERLSTGGTAVVVLELDWTPVAGDVRLALNRNQADAP